MSGPSGVGKGTVVRSLIARRPRLFLSVSATTRRPRPFEHDGVDYRFVSDAEFDRMIARGDLLEWAEIFGHRSGTPAEPLRDATATGRDALLEIDVQGARQIRERVPGAVLVFLAPPSIKELEARLRSRGTEDEGKLARRLATADAEMADASWFDHVIVNDDVEGATTQVAAILDAHREPEPHELQGPTPP